MSSPEARDLLAEVRRLAERVPLPHPIWHRFVPEMHAVVRDLFLALDTLAELPHAQAELVRSVDSDLRPALDDTGSPALAAARARLAGLPVPQGEHPYLDEIMLTLEAAGAVLAALTVAGGEDAFAGRLREE
jgi:hypothetical protein